MLTERLRKSRMGRHLIRLEVLSGKRGQARTIRQISLYFVRKSKGGNSLMGDLDYWIWSFVGTCELVASQEAMGKLWI